MEGDKDQVEVLSTFVKFLPVGKDDASIAAGHVS
jgi:hypothetical protein